MEKVTMFLFCLSPIIGILTFAVIVDQIIKKLKEHEESRKT